MFHFRKKMIGHYPIKLISKLLIFPKNIWSSVSLSFPYTFNDCLFWVGFNEDYYLMVLFGFFQHVYLEILPRNVCCCESAVPGCRYLRNTFCKRSDCFSQEPGELSKSAAEMASGRLLAQDSPGCNLLTAYQKWATRVLPAVAWRVTDTRGAHPPRSLYLCGRG